MYFFKEELVHIKKYFGEIINFDIQELDEEIFNKFIINLQTYISKQLPAFACVCDKNPQIVQFLKHKRLISYWDKELCNIHKLSIYMTDDLHEQRKQEGVHSLDSILGHYYYGNARRVYTIAKSMREEQDKGNLVTQEEIDDKIVYADELLSTAEKYVCFPAMQLAIHFLLEKLDHSDTEEEKENNKNKLLDKIEVLIKSPHGTPAYICAAYMWIEIAERFEKNKKQCHFMALVSVYTAQFLEMDCKNSILNAYKNGDFSKSNPYGLDKLSSIVIACEKQVEKTLTKKEDRLEAQERANIAANVFKENLNSKLLNKTPKILEFN